MQRYEDDKKMFEALTEYFSNTGLSMSSYLDDYFEIKTLGRSIKLPNPLARREAIKIHDLNHILTEYDTSFAAEAQISAFELGSGIPAEYIAAWFFNCNAVFVGMLHSPIKTVKAFLKGRATHNSLYNIVPFCSSKSYEDVMCFRVGFLRETLGVNNSKPIEARDLALILLASAVGAAVTPLIVLGIAYAWVCSFLDKK